MNEIIKIIDINNNYNNEYLSKLKNRSGEIKKEILLEVEDILKNVRVNGDEALIKYTKKFDSDCINEKNICVTKKEIEEAYEKVDKDFIQAISLAQENIKDFHKRQKQNSWMNVKESGIIMGQKVRGLENVGIYVPGGTAAYPSSVLMNAIPAKVAEVSNVIMVTPPLEDGSVNPYILVAADVAKVDKIYKIGGAQAIAALAFGTKIIPKVDKIVGPGNIYVATAKRSVYGYVDIDMIAGPSEILIISDESGEAKFIAADLMSQAEHDKLASSILITNSLELAKKVREELKTQIYDLQRKDIILYSLKNYGMIIVVNDIEQGIDIANKIAPEHLEIMVKEPFNILGKIKNAGSIFLGKYAPEPLGDYIAGPNHVLPTSGTAKFFSPLSVDDFIKKSSFISYSEEELYKFRNKIIKLAETEGLTAHANSIKVRFDNLDKGE